MNFLSHRTYKTSVPTKSCEYKHVSILLNSQENWLLIASHFFIAWKPNWVSFFHATKKAWKHIYFYPRDQKTIGTSEKSLHTQKLLFGYELSEQHQEQTSTGSTGKEVEWLGAQVSIRIYGDAVSIWNVLSVMTRQKLISNLQSLISNINPFDQSLKMVTLIRIKSTENIRTTCKFLTTPWTPQRLLCLFLSKKSLKHLGWFGFMREGQERSGKMGFNRWSVLLSSLISSNNEGSLQVAIQIKIGAFSCLRWELLGSGLTDTMVD